MENIETTDLPTRVLAKVLQSARTIEHLRFTYPESEKRHRAITNIQRIIGTIVREFSTTEDGLEPHEYEDDQDRVLYIPDLQTVFIRQQEA